MQGISVIVIALSLSGIFALSIPKHELPEAILQKAEAMLREQPTLEMPVHEMPKASLRVPSWSAKIPDIEVNLALAQQWMSLNATLDANGSSGELLNGDLPNGTVVMVAGVKDAPHYYDCGLAMNTAWGAMARNPCSMKVWDSSDKMKEMVPKCSELRYGERYTESYRALKLDQDTWCGGPSCNPECQEGVKCFRSFEFPFSPVCEGNLTVVGAEAPEEKPDRSLLGQRILAVGMMFLCVGMAFIPTPKPKRAAPMA